MMSRFMLVGSQRGLPFPLQVRTKRTAPERVQTRAKLAPGARAPPKEARPPRPAEERETRCQLRDLLPNADQRMHASSSSATPPSPRSCAPTTARGSSSSSCSASCRRATR
ncbi:hypothetical protein ACFPRL_11490 [Pseudoclavibacter helvolus]